MYLDGGAEQLTYYNSTKAITAQRYYANIADGTVIVRSYDNNAKTTTISYDVANTQHTALEAIIPSSGTPIARRYFDPWGSPAGAAPSSWPDNHAFLGKPADPNTSLDLLGARQYDPVTGSFLSLDPVMQTGDPLALGGYAYADNNPATNADPTGKMVVAPGGGGCYNCMPPPIQIGVVTFPAYYPHVQQILAGYQFVIKHDPLFVGPLVGPNGPIDQLRALQLVCLSGGYGSGPCPTSLQNKLSPIGGGSLAGQTLVAAIAAGMGGVGAVGMRMPALAIADDTSAVGIDVNPEVNLAAEDVGVEIGQQLTAEEAKQQAIDLGNVKATAPQNHLNGAMVEQLGWQGALTNGQIGIQAPGKVTAVGPDFLTFNQNTDTIVVWDAKYSSSGKFLTTISASKMQSWMPAVTRAVNNYSGSYAVEIQTALKNGQVEPMIFPYGPSSAG